MFKNIFIQLNIIKLGLYFEKNSKLVWSAVLINYIGVSLFLVIITSHCSAFTHTHRCFKNSCHAFCDLKNWCCAEIGNQNKCCVPYKVC